MQTKRSTKNRSKAIRGRGRSFTPLHEPKQTHRSGVASKAIGGAVFRPDLLELDLKEKSGFLMPERGFSQSPFIDKIEIISAWYNTLKTWKTFKPIKVNIADSPDEVLDKLKSFTDRIFKGYSWVIKFDSVHGDCDIHYYKSLGDASLWDMPLEWLDKHKDPIIRELGLYMIKALSQKFGIDCVTCYWTYYELDHFSNEEELRDYMKHEMGYDNPESEVMYTNYLEYVKGRPYELERELRKMSFSKRFYKNRLELIRNSHKKIHSWLQKGLELLDEDFEIKDFEFEPDNPEQINSDMIPFSQCFWFPYSDRDLLYESTTQIMDDEAMNMGINDIYEHGNLKPHSKLDPVPYSKLNKLFNFFRTGNRLNPLKKHR